jgi:hypothetical protein
LEQWQKVDRADDSDNKDPIPKIVTKRGEVVMGEELLVVTLVPASLCVVDIIAGIIL